MANDLLNLSTTIQRNQIKIDGQTYLLRHMSEFSLMERHQMAANGKRMQGLKELGEEHEGSAAAVQGAADALHQTILRILIDGTDIAEKLNDEQKLAILQCFFEQAGQGPVISAAEAAAIPANGKKPRGRPRGSKNSTEGIRKTG